MPKKISFQTKQWIKQAVQRVVLPACYCFFRIRRVDFRRVVFADAHHNSRPEAMELLYQRLKRDGKWEIEEHYLDCGTAGALAVARHSISFMWRYAGAGFVVICDNFLPAASCRKKQKTKVLQLWHACGCYKKFGYDAKDDIPPNYRGGHVYRNTDLVTVSGEAAREPFASAMQLPKSAILALGVSRTDLLLDPAWQEARRRSFYEAYPQSKGKKIALWAPTFRGNAGQPEVITPDLERLEKELGEEWMLLACPHPHLLHGVQEKGKQAQWKRYFCPIPTQELYPVADVVIADYSSLIYEVLLLGKPLVLFVPDLEQYRKERGFYMDPSKIPAPCVEREQELADAVRTARVEREKTDAFLKKYMGACDGRATERIAAWMESCENHFGGV